MYQVSGDKAAMYKMHKCSSSTNSALFVVKLLALHCPVKTRSLSQ